METWIEIGGLQIGAPVTAFTNLLLGVQCAVYWRRLRAGVQKHADVGRARGWSLFFLAMAVATLAGVPKHGLEHVLATDVYAWVLWASSLGSAVSVYYAQCATVSSCADSEWGPRLVGLCRIEAAAFVGASLFLGPEMWLVVVNTALGLVPVIAAEVHAWRRGSSGAGWIVTGLGISLLTGAVYVTGVSLGRWFNHVDIAHVLMGVSFFLIGSGALSKVGTGPGEGAPVRRKESRRELLGSFIPSAREMG